jgi:hypothetical protein
MTIQRVDWDRRFDLTSVTRWLNADRIEAHVASAFEATPLELDPYPHIVVNNWLPHDVYDRIIDAMPASIFFAHDRDQHWAVPMGVAPLYSRHVWAFVAQYDRRRHSVQTSQSDISGRDLPLHTLG